MSLMWRRIATSSPNPSPTIASQADTDMTTTTSSPYSNPTIGPYSHGLNGVNQPVNMIFKDSLWMTLGFFAVLVMILRMLQVAWSKLRQLSAMSVPAERQTYWKTCQFSWMPSLKKYLVYAPLWRKRHNREIRLSSAFSVGTLPSRLHFIILFVYAMSNIAYCLVLNWSNKNGYEFTAELRGRTGTLAAVNMVPLIILAGRNNPLIHWLGVSFDTYNLLHRWMGRTVIIEAIIHTLAWLYVQVADSGWESVQIRIVHESFVASGLCGTIALSILIILSLSPIRHAFYETFLNVHIILAFIVFGCTWVHCATAEIPGGLPQLPWAVAIFMLWLADRLARMLRSVYFNWSKKGFTEAVVTAMPGDTCRVSLYLPRYVDVKPGTHAYIRFHEVHPWESHPFSIAWVEHFPCLDKEKMLTKDEITEADIRRGTTAVSFIIGAHTGFTRSLFNRASSITTESLHLRAVMEGPYAGHHQLDSYGHAVLFAGATGITHQLSYLKPIIEGYVKGTVATRKVTLIWVMRDYEALEWIRPWMDEVLRLPRRKEIFKMKLFITRPKNSKEIFSASKTVEMFPGRPNILTLLKKEVEEQVGAMCVTVCGPGALADDVRQAVREVQDERSVVDFVEESFTW